MCDEIKCCKSNRKAHLPMHVAISSIDDDPCSKTGIAVDGMHQEILINKVRNL